MTSPRHIPAAAAGPGNKENISENGATLLDCPAEVAFSAKGKKQPTGFNLRKSIAWNSAFFTEQGVLDSSELSVLTGSELMANGTPSSGISGIMMPLCRSRKYDNINTFKQIAGKSPGKVSSSSSRAQNQGRRLFSSAKTPQRDEQKEPVETQNRNSARSFQKRIPRVPTGSTYLLKLKTRSTRLFFFGYTQKKVPNSTSTTPMSRISKKPLSSLPMAPRSTTPATTVTKSNKKLAPVKAEHMHRVSALLPKSKIDSGPSMKTNVVPAAAAIHKETSGSVKFENPEINPSSFRGTTSSTAKPSALRMPSPSVGFFNQEKAKMSHGNAVERNMGRFSAGSTSSLVKPPRYKLPEDLKASHLSTVLSTNCTTASNLVSLPVMTDSNTNNLVTSVKQSLSKIISTYSAKSRDANYQERPEVHCSLAGSGGTAEPLSLVKNDGARNSMPIAYKDASRVERRGIIKEIKPDENSLSLKATCFSTIEATCSSSKPMVESKLSPSCISSQRNDLSYQSQTDSSFIAAADLGERALPVLSEGESFTLDTDSYDHHNADCATSMECTSHTDQMPPSSSSSDGKPALDDRNSVFNDSLHDEGKFSLPEETNTDVGTLKASTVTEDSLLHMECERNHNVKRCSPVKLEGTEDSCSPKATCSSTKPSVGSKSIPSCISSQGNDLICQGMTESGSIGAKDLESSYVGERKLPVSLPEGESCTLDIDSFQNSDSCDHHNTECATSMESVEYTFCADQIPLSSSSGHGKPALDDKKSVLNDSLYDEGKSALSEEPNTDGGTELETKKASATVTEDPLLHVGCERNHSFRRTKCLPVKPEAPMTCVERQNVLSAEQNMEDKMELGSNKLLDQEGASHIEKEEGADRPRTNTILRDHLKSLVPFTEEWLAVMEACGQEVLEQKSGAVQNSPPDKTGREPSPWSPVKRKAQDVGPFDCTKYSKSVRTSGTP
ncbi:hypothetical protein QOZ80_9BG0695370 [Eleusine coracana subsp. coracana]|nr:hypothetical protein QOZ80_9BG0695370 [Eleusine coracana subsp. coracana]